MPSPKQTTSQAGKPGQQKPQQTKAQTPINQSKEFNQRTSQPPSAPPKPLIEPPSKLPLPPFTSSNVCPIGGGKNTAPCPCCCGGPEVDVDNPKDPCCCGDDEVLDMPNGKWCIDPEVAAGGVGQGEPA